MPLFRRRLTCFYCGTQSGLKWQAGLTRFECQTCEATNYLDDKGEITDPPAASGSKTPTHAKSSASFVQAFTSSPPELAGDGSNIFCRTCVTNQQIYTQSLASYLPPASDPRFAEYERSLPAYQAQLEKNYPQVCAECAPRANARLRASMYAARLDHLRRQVVKTRQQGAAASTQSTGKYLLFLLGGLLWWTSLAMQLLWNTTGLFAPTEEMVMPADAGLYGTVSCVWQTLSTRQRLQACEDRYSYVGKAGFFLLCLSLWWHSRLSALLVNSNVRLVGYGDYAILQLAVLATRGFTWWLLYAPYESKLVRRLDLPLEALHGFMICFTILTTLLSLPLVKVKRRVIPSFTNIPDLIAAPTSDAVTHSLSIEPQSNAARPTFPVSKLDPLGGMAASNKGRFADGHDHDSMLDETESIFTETTTADDRMEWEPIRGNNFHPTRVNVAQRNLSNIPSQSPFRGTLPPAPEPWAHRLSKPRQPAFQEASAMRKANFAQSLAKATNPGTPVYGNRSAGGRGFKMADPQFTFDEQQPETGLEDLFGTSFSVRDDRMGEEVEDLSGQRASRSGQPAPTGDLQSMRSDPLPYIVAGCGLCLAGLVGLGWGEQIVQRLAG